MPHRAASATMGPERKGMRMAGPVLGWRGAAALFVLGMMLGVGRCEYGSIQAGAVASAEHCGGEALTPVLHTRLSRYSAGIPSSDVYVLQLCHPQRGCRAIASYRNGLPPIARIEEDRLHFSIPMARDLEVFDDRAWVRGRDIPMVIEAWAVRSDADLARAYRAYGVDPAARVHYLDCRRDSAPRPYYPGSA
jgi:hypothetical protein